MTYTAQLRELGGGFTTVILSATDLPEAIEEAGELLVDWINEGDYPDEGALVPAEWTVFDEDNAIVACESADVQVEPNHDRLLRKAGGDPDCEHEWVATVEVDGGLDQNPGMFTGPGTGLVISRHCDHCRMRRIETFHGIQRSPGQADTVHYEPL